MSIKYEVAASVFFKFAVISIFLSVGSSSAIGKIADGRTSDVVQWNKYFPIPASYLKTHLLNKFQIPIETAVFKSNINWVIGELQDSLKAAALQEPVTIPHTALASFPSQIVPLPISLPHASGIPLPVARPAFKAPLQTRKAPGDYGVLSSVAVDIRNLPARKDWLSVSQGDHTGLFRQKCSGSAKVCLSDLAIGVAAAVSKSQAWPTLERVSRINRAVNRALDYQSDQQIFGRADYWANPNEVAVLGVGDCEDFAIAKLWALRSIGLTPEQLQFVVIKDTRRNVLHAVLAVHLDGQTYILDSLSDKVATQGAFPNYKPIMSFAANKSYLHGFGSKPVQTATRKVGRNNS